MRHEYYFKPTGEAYYINLLINWNSISSHVATSIFQKQDVTRFFACLQYIIKCHG